MTITGATTAMAVVVSPSGGAALDGSVEYHGYVSAANTVTVAVCNVDKNPATPTARTYNVRVLP